MFAFAWLIPLLPLLAATWIAGTYVLLGNRGEAGERWTARIAVGAAALSLGLAVLTPTPASAQVPGRFYWKCGFFIPNAALWNGCQFWLCIPCKRLDLVGDFVFSGSYR